MQNSDSHSLAVLNLGASSAPGASFLVGVGCAEYARVIKCLSNDLHSRRNARTCKAGRNRHDRTLTYKIERHGHVTAQGGRYLFAIEWKNGGGWGVIVFDRG